MAPPSALHIATQSVARLVKEQTSYHKELAGQQARIQKLEADIKAGSPELDQNAEYVLKQEQAAVAETKNVFEPLRLRIAEAVQTLEAQIAADEGDGKASAEELEKAREALKTGQKAAEEGKENGAKEA